jgi:hypothetical protein
MAWSSLTGRDGGKRRGPWPEEARILLFLKKKKQKDFIRLPASAPRW